MKKQNLLLPVCFLALIFYASCKKNETPNYSQIALEASLAESAFTDVFTKVDDESKNGNFRDSVGKREFAYRSLADTCAIITLNTNGGSFPMTLTIDFGSGCTTGSITRKGKIICTYTGPYRDSSSRVIVELDNYYVDGFKVEGSHVITNNGRNAGGNLSYSVDVSNGRITKPDGGIITWESKRTNEWVEGENTVLSWCDDVYHISGYGQGTTANGHDYRLDITSPLVKKICCFWVTQGSISLHVDGSQVASVDYGSGTCDRIANLFYNHQTYVIIIQ